MSLLKFATLLVVGGLTCLFLGAYLIEQWIAFVVLLLWGIALTAIHWRSPDTI